MMKISPDYINISEEEYKINLDNNEAFIDIDKNLLMKIKSALIDIQFNKYPDCKMDEIKTLYAEYAGCNVENIIIGNGSIETLELAISSEMNSGKKALTFNPDFEMYDFFISRFGGEIRKYDLDCEKEVDMNDLIKCINDEKIDLIVISNPNDPLGTLIKNNDLVNLLEQCSNTKVIIDEAYYEFSGESMIKYIDKYKNLIITRTLSKAWGLAGLRMGFLITNKENIGELLEYKIPYTIDSYSLEVAKILLKYPNNIIENAKKTINQRDEVFKGLKDIQKNAAMKIEFYPSNSNYIYGKTDYKEALMKGLKERGIRIKNLKDNSFRISIGSPLENRKMLDGIREIFVY